MIAINAMDMVGFINWLDYGENGTILISWEDGNWGLPSIYSVDKKGLVEFVKKRINKWNLLTKQNKDAILNM